MSIKALIFISLFFILGSCVSQAQVNEYNFGDETIKQMKKGKYALSCNDAKYFVVLAKAVIKDVGTSDQSLQNSKNFEKVLRRFEKKLKKLTASKYRETRDKMEEAADNGLGGLFNLVMEKQYGQAEESDLNEYMNANFCGKNDRF